MAVAASRLGKLLVPQTALFVCDVQVNNYPTIALAWLVWPLHRHCWAWLTCTDACWWLWTVSISIQERFRDLIHGYPTVIDTSRRMVSVEDGRRHNAIKPSPLW